MLLVLSLIFPCSTTQIVTQVLSQHKSWGILDSGSSLHRLENIRTWQATWVNTGCWLSAIKWGNKRPPATRGNDQMPPSVSYSTRKEIGASVYSVTAYSKTLLSKWFIKPLQRILCLWTLQMWKFRCFPFQISSLLTPAELSSLLRHHLLSLHGLLNASSYWQVSNQYEFKTHRLGTRDL